MVVNITGDTASEANETFSLNLTSPLGATISDTSGVATIIDDDRCDAGRDETASWGPDNVLVGISHKPPLPPQLITPNSARRGPTGIAAHGVGATGERNRRAYCLDEGAPVARRVREYRSPQLSDSVVARGGRDHIGRP